MAEETNQEEQDTSNSAVPVLEMSDEDFLKLNGPVTEAASAASETVIEDQTKSDAGEGEAKTADAETSEATAEDGSADEEVKAEAEADTDKDADAKAAASDKTEADAKTEAGAEKADATDSGEAKSEDQDKSGEETSKAETDEVGDLNEILKPFKANGRDIQVKNVGEAIKLMQMGANYTRKLQELQPHRKIVTMLSNNDLLDEGKLSFLIDLDKGDPEAIKKLIKDKGVDVLDIDTSVDPAYKPGSHIVDDAEVSFRSATEDLLSQDGGSETIQIIHDKWDDASKQALWERPEILARIHEQRETGAYATITLEMERQITLGNIPANTPFLEAYTLVGDALVAAQKQRQSEGGQPGEKQELSGSAPQPVAIKAAAPKPALANSDKAKAAAPSRSGQKKVEVLKNPLAQSDEEFLKEMAGRV